MSFFYNALLTKEIKDLDGDLFKKSSKNWMVSVHTVKMFRGILSTLLFVSRPISIIQFNVFLL